MDQPNLFWISLAIVVALAVTLVLVNLVVWVVRGRYRRAHLRARTLPRDEA
ncbi:hypothetical protein [Phenylobacterium hankyongense]|uniref:hypothetical protein n=1 Tax=Phenylobacterium hankyongense TaxID=1813876 RepID=UPI001401CC78|nr:hypothetical protein [Phenylobacterium hankyongense]